MEDASWTWPAWKFGMKRDDLFTTLHDQYNTIPYSLQDPEAFHLDVYEISRDADTVDKFHQMMADRRLMRLRELNDSLETLAVEIIANPKLMGTEQWQQALQFFRTKSYDSIVRYFASYLPDEYLDRHDTHSTTSASLSETDSMSTAASSVDDVPSPFVDDDDFFPNGHVMTAEPSCSAAADEAVQREFGRLGEPLSPPHSEAGQPELPVSSPASTNAESSNECSTNPPSRSMSFSGSESGHVVPELIRQRRYLDDDDLDETLQVDVDDDCDTAITSLCDSIECSSAADDGAIHVDSQAEPEEGEALEFDDDEDLPTAQHPADELDYLDYTTPFRTYDSLESDTPTPRPEAATAAFHLQSRSANATVARPSRGRSPSQRSASPKLLLLASRGGASPTRQVRRSPEESLSKIQKPAQDLMRKRPKARRRVGLGSEGEMAAVFDEETTQGQKKGWLGK
ncbi:uncharacterized protein UV8b_01647 [Ustilaginoidea virens]|uniref:Uncharacterized protein n=1 Tax=Ustilaginoidea virens TaxID=1159556 RepID=A0A063BVE9_USTVR|nr:uncharacterized protein UV8b_01647 [Ustilaginoidea virens]QUC17406.1 hypothetical protein UV8b_01647 [Ustilaginoidea virens]GAO13713.1 hypothetical protein UVI_02018120 [Ustilaginoidea virens]